MKYISEVYPLVSYISQMRFAGVDWVGCRFAGVIHNIYYDREDGIYRISVGASLKLQVSLPFDDLVRYHITTTDMSLEIKEGYFFGEPLFILDLCFAFAVELVFHLEVTEVSYIVSGLSDTAIFSSLRLIEEFFSKNWNSRLLDSFAISSRFAAFVETEYFYVRFFRGTLERFALYYLALVRQKTIKLVMRLWVIKCLLFLEGMLLQISKVGRVRGAVQSIGRLYFVGGRRVLGSLLSYSRFRDLSVHFVTDIYFLEVILLSLRNYYGLLNATKPRLLSKRKVLRKRVIRVVGRRKTR